MTAPVWSMAETHCVLCLRPFAPERATAEYRVEDDEFCWVNEGRPCISEVEGWSELTLLVGLRGQNEALSDEVVRLRGTALKPGDRVHLRSRPTVTGTVADLPVAQVAVQWDDAPEGFTVRQHVGSLVPAEGPAALADEPGEGVAS